VWARCTRGRYEGRRPHGGVVDDGQCADGTRHHAGATRITLPAFSHSRWLVDRAVGLADVQHTDAGDVVMWRGGGQLSYRVGDVLSTEHRAITLPICAGPNTGGSITLGDVLDSGKALLIGKSFHT
jgi:hypothetical protein